MFKPVLSIALIGKIRFFIGLILGFGLCLYLSLGVNSHQKLEVFSGNLGLILTFLKSFQVVTYSSSLMIFVWFFFKKFKNPRTRIYIKLNQMRLLFALLVFPTMAGLILQSPVFAYFWELEASEFKLILPSTGMISYFTFYYNWNILRIIFDARKCLNYNLYFAILYSLVLTFYFFK